MCPGDPFPVGVARPLILFTGILRNIPYAKMDTRTNATDAEAMAIVVAVDVPEESSFPFDGGVTTKASRRLSRKLAEATAGANSAIYSSSERAALMASYANFFASFAPVSSRMVVEASMT